MKRIIVSFLLGSILTAAGLWYGYGTMTGEWIGFQFTIVGG